MIHIIQTVLAGGFFVAMTSKFVVFIKDTLFKMWSAELPRVLDFSCIKFMLFGAIVLGMNPHHKETLVVLTIAYVHYTVLLWRSTIKLRSQNFSWPNLVWQMASHVGGPYVAWPDQSESAR